MALLKKIDLLNPVLCIAFSPDSKVLASATRDNTVQLWNIPSGDLNAELKGHERAVFSVAFSPDGKSIVTGSIDKTVRTWSVATKQQVQILNGHSDYVYSVAWSPNDDVIASGSNDETVILWDAVSGSVKKKLTGHTSSVISVSFSQNGSKLASTGGWDETAIIWDVNSGAALTKLTHSSIIYSVCFSPDDQFVVTGCDDKIVRMFNTNTGREEKRFEGHTDRVFSVAISFDGSMIASGSSDNSVRLWDVASTKQLQQLDGHTSDVMSVAFSRDGKFIASGSLDQTIRLWNQNRFGILLLEVDQLSDIDLEANHRFIQMATERTVQELRVVVTGKSLVQQPVSQLQVLLEKLYFAATRVAYKANRLLLAVEVLLVGPSGSLEAIVKDYTKCDVIFTQNKLNEESHPINACRDKDLPAIHVEFLKTHSQATSLLHDGVTDVSPQDRFVGHFKQVVLGGTFDHLHAGHKILLSVSALLASKRIVCGVTDESMVKKKKYFEQMESIDVRINSVLSFLKRFRPGLNYEVVPISDPFGPSIVHADLEAIIVSQETISGGKAVNEKRLEKGLSQLEIVVINMLSDQVQPFLAEELMNLKISSTGIRKYLSEP